jgi:hypothetical protein
MLCSFINNNQESIDIWRDIWQSPDFVIRYDTGKKVKHTDVVPMKDGPWTLNTRNLFRLGRKISLPPPIDKKFFSYGTTSIEDASFLFFGDSNHSDKKLCYQRLDLIFNHTVREGDIVVFEGLPSEFILAAHAKGQRITIRGCENAELYKRCIGQLKKDLKNDGKVCAELVRQIFKKRNKVFSQNLKNISKDLRPGQRILVHWGEGHICKQILEKFPIDKIIAIYDRTIKFVPLKNLQEEALKYYTSSDSFMDDLQKFISLPFQVDAMYAQALQESLNELNLQISDLPNLPKEDTEKLKSKCKEILQKKKEETTRNIPVSNASFG